MNFLHLFIAGTLISYFVKTGDCQCDVVRLAAAVHETLSPLMAEMREYLAAVKTEIKGDLVAVKTEMRQGLIAIEENLTTIEQNMKEEFQKISNFQMAHHGYECGGTGGWRRVVYLNMTDPNTNCPSGWKLTTYSNTTCGRASNSQLSCDSVFFPVSRGDYTSVCGSIRAYQYDGTDGFQAYHDGYVTTIEGAYVASISLTHGSPRQHIWTFAAGYSEDRPTRRDICPCDASINITIPPFVGEDYFCESGVNSGYTIGFYPNDPLWDGEDCSSSSSCCSFNNPPYFTKQLPSSTSDPIEARICMMVEDEDSAVEFIELYVK